MMAADACSFDVTTVMASILGEPAIEIVLRGGGGGERGEGGNEDRQGLH